MDNRFTQFIFGYRLRSIRPYVVLYTCMVGAIVPGLLIPWTISLWWPWQLTILSGRVLCVATLIVYAVLWCRYMDSIIGDL